MTIAVMGAGAFGTALALTLVSKGPVTLWARDADHAQQMRRDRENKRRLPDQKLPEHLRIADPTDTLETCDTVLISVPMQHLRGFLSDHANTLRSKTLVACCKGIELGSGLGPHQVLAHQCPDNPAALLTGPSFAADIATGLPTALTLACTDVEIGKALQYSLSTQSLRLYRTTDVTGAALGGALKNVIAIACGATIGAGLGDSARAALITRGNAEMTRFAQLRGADPATLTGLSGFGDLVLTCTSALSRNFRLGVSIGQGATFDPSITVEGAATAQAMHRIATDQGLDMPITSVVAALVENRLDVTQAIARLLSRSLKEE